MLAHSTVKGAIFRQDAVTVGNQCLPERKHIPVTKAPQLNIWWRELKAMIMVLCYYHMG
jgi:hypothetical protein